DRHRLTETGLSLGTPGYMSPEQAAGDRQLDARSDVYALGAVLYEMLAGEPPHTAASAQVLISRIIMEEPRRLRAIRSTIPEGIDAAVALALAKVPADRHASASALAEALLRPASPAAVGHARVRSRGWRFAAAAAVAATAVLAVALVLARHPWNSKPVSYDSIQLTTSGRAASPVLSPDGAQIAYATYSCATPNKCTWSIIVRETATEAERPVVEELDDAYPYQWSPDGLYLLFSGERHDLPFGIYAVSRLGGLPVKVSDGAALFLPAGDTILTAGAAVFNQREGIELYLLPPPWKAAVDSLRVVPPATGTGLTSIRVTTSGRWMALAWTDALQSMGTVTLHDRTGRRTDSLTDAHLTVSGAEGVRWSPDAHSILLPLESHGRGALLLRVAVDLDDGRFGRRDTVQLAPGVTSSYYYDLSADGRSLAYSAFRPGETAIWAGRARGAGLAERQLVSSSREMAAVISRDGQQILYSKRTAVGDSLGVQWFAMPFDSGASRAVTPALKGVSDIEIDDRRILVAQTGEQGRQGIASFDLASMRMTVVGQEPPGSYWMRVGPGGGILLVSESGDSVRLLDRSGRELWRAGFPDTIGRIAEVIPSPDLSGYIAVAQPVSQVLDRQNLITMTLVRIDASTGALRVVSRLRATAIRGPYEWSNDGWLYFSMSASASKGLQLYRMRPEGGSPQVRRERPEGSCSLAGDAQRWVCVRSQSLSDIYLIRNFRLASR
ncbi:MAG: hypothetical protein ABJD11_18880, partial [Gemmatimonadota bacterium]